MPYNLNIPGHMFESELKIIESWARSIPKNGVVVEVGSFFGRSAVCWAMSADPSVKIYCGDRFSDQFTTSNAPVPMFGELAGHPLPNTTYYQWHDFKENIKDFPNVIPMRGMCPQGITYPGDPIDIFFLDAAHTNPSDWENITYFSQFLKPNSMICGHDYFHSFPDVIENVKRLEDLHKTKATIYGNGGSLWSIAITPKIENTIKLPSVSNKYTKTRPTR
jgi:hypothetical protein